MLDRIVKITAIAAAVAVITVSVIGGVAWAVRLDTQVEDLREEVAQLRSDVAQLQQDMVRVQENQQAILDALQSFQDALVVHTHDDEGRTQFSLSR